MSRIHHLDLNATIDSKLHILGTTLSVDAAMQDPIEEDKIALLGTKYLGLENTFYFKDPLTYTTYSLFNPKLNVEGILSCFCFVQIKDFAIVTGGMANAVVRNDAFKIYYGGVQDQSLNYMVKYANVRAVYLAPMLKPRHEHVAASFVNKYLYVIGGNSDFHGEKYDIKNNKWSYLPSNIADFTKGSLTVIDERYLFAIKEGALVAGEQNKIFAERLDTLEESKGWESLAVNIEPTIENPLIIRCQFIGNGKLLVLRTYSVRGIILCVYDVDENKMTRKVNTPPLYLTDTMTSLEKSCVCFYTVSGSSVHSLHYSFCKAEAVYGWLSSLYMDMLTYMNVIIIKD